MNKRKLNRIYAGLLGLLVVLGSGCGNEEEQRPELNGVYMTPTSPSIVEKKEIILGKGNFAKVDLAVALYQIADEDVKVTIAQNNSLVKAYNEKHGTDYLEIPEEYIQFSTKSPVIEKGKMASSPIELNINSESLLFATSYMLPLEIMSVEGGNIQMNKSMNIKYYNIQGGPPPNIAVGKPTSQKSTAHGGISSRAVDGNTNGFWANGSITHTGTRDQDWWEVDLEEISPLITTIKLYNRMDGGPSTRLSDFHVFVSDVPFESTVLSETMAQEGVFDYFFEGPAGEVTEIPVDRTGRYIRVQLEGRTEPLSLAEVEVLAL
ncbi:DUF1735 domain-containing protein [Echinicola soli]|uniref:DUF1735 domain-containing protein n=1 Tax=Echinicola soli TaxID=2591634 RepID=A0A514CJ48_9BACT|nr:DUF1735 domain-containing protein [Echinicola soli]QDH79848.1 DUF1735 domain-containing protein [Echinicola soli]